MIIAIASGKGGTGKTTIATSLALVCQESEPVTFLDCDVEAPNAHFFLQPEFHNRQAVTKLIPRVIQADCNECGRCAQVCAYHAIVCLGKKVLVFPQLCHGCGSCRLNCPEQAIVEVPIPIGAIEHGPTPDGISFWRGILNIGEPMAVPVIRQLKKHRPSQGLVIYDAPPGVSCPVVETLRGADFLLLVTEPTPFGLHDLKAMIEVVRTMDIPAGIIINRDGVGNDCMETYLRVEQIPVLMRIPIQRKIAEVLATGTSLVTAFPTYVPKFQEMHEQILTISAQRFKELV